VPYRRSSAAAPTAPTPGAPRQLVGGIPTQGDEVRHLLGIDAVARAYFRRADPSHFASRRRLRTRV
jgi:hypothetical protein